MNKGFVFGKFLPFHKGHEAMINFAQLHCDFLTVLVCCSDQENIPGNVRKNWIEKSFYNNQNIEIKIFNYLESELPNTSVSSETVSKSWAKVFKEKLPNYNLLVTSEEYGNFVAKYMNIVHIPFDTDRKEIPISSTAIRNNIFKYWNYLPLSVKQDYAIKVAILGTESTGKSTLTQKLAEYYNCSFILEAGREIIANSNSFSIDDLNLVAEEHAKRIESNLMENSPLLIMDTDIHITKSYAFFTFNKELKIDNYINKLNKANLYLYLNNDVKHIQDGTRLNEKNRNSLDISHRRILNEHQIQYFEIKGKWDERFKLAIELIDDLIKRFANNNITSLIE